MIKICKETKNRNKRQISVIKKKPNNYLEALGFARVAKFSCTRPGRNLTTKSISSISFLFP